MDAHLVCTKQPNVPRLEGEADSGFIAYCVGVGVAEK